MFSGIIEGKAFLKSMELTKKGGRLVLSVPVVYAKLPKGASVAVNGACLTVSGRGGKTLRFDLLRETLKRTSFGKLRIGAALNLERALKWNKRIDGHFVQGHVDGSGRVLKVVSAPREKSFLISFPAGLKRYFVRKGSVAVNGVSLTIGHVRGASFWVHVIPTTLKKTNMNLLKTGDTVNLEADILLKFFRRLTSSQGQYKLSRLKS